jgi:hypothetical protein
MAKTHSHYAGAFAHGAEVAIWFSVVFIVCVMFEARGPLLSMEDAAREQIFPAFSGAAG